jgi:hypothetical protein
MKKFDLGGKMGQQVAFIIVITLCGMIFFQILLLHKRGKKYYTMITKDIKLLKEKFNIK